MNVSGHFGLFHGLNVVGLLLVVVLYVMYRVLRLNLLVRSAACICALMAVLLMAGMFVPYVHLQSDLVCSIQAVILNYAHVSLHAHFCFLMVANLFGAKGWRLFGIRDIRQLTGLMVGLSLTLPMVSLILVMSELSDGLMAPGGGLLLFRGVVERKAFFCTVNKPAWLAYRAWFIAFSGPGITCATILFVEMWRSRQSILQLKSTTQFGVLRLLHLFLAILIYLGMAVGSVWVGLSPVVDLKHSHRRLNLVALLGELCDAEVVEGSWREFRRILCPSPHIYLPVSAGWALFFIYGFGSAALGFYSRVWAGLSKGEKRRDSRASSVASSWANGSRKQSVRRVSALSLVDDDLLVLDRPQSLPQAPNPPAQRKQMRRGSEPHAVTKQRIDRLRISSSRIENIPEEEDAEEEEDGEDEEVDEQSFEE